MLEVNELFRICRNQWETSDSIKLCVLLSLIFLLTFCVPANAQATLDGLDCPSDRPNQPFFSNSHILFLINNLYIVYECDIGFQYENNTDGILWCNRSTGLWTGSPGVCKQIGPCSPNPCLNGGSCSTSDDPFGWGYFCYCPEKYGGRRCEISDPCNSNPCPSGTKYCWRNFSDDLGRWCYNANWVVM